ncbi:cell division ATP-binding protein FtsE [Oerskovia sp. Sa2CUA9]|uniref:Cell division ATP-binding protein FtsE n=1 Tax=Oerskovia merdavium TaxID=2762227 RepID=A0ABR8U0I6_9CELL|nr:cell division ATP-binding protein FtsE [Oerskovia merdavium]MBD7981208.1 cell division ATP-binding protein FtsE [Oerskovia merdavium]
MIRFENVSKVYARGARPALDDMSAEIERGEFVFLVGASGSGKSTCLRLVLREERPTRGKVFVAGRDLSTLSSWKVPSLRRQIGVVFQDFRLLQNKTVFENVAFALQVTGKPRHTIAVTVPEVLEMVGLQGKEKRRPHELSGGEQQRVAIARAFVNRPSILLADEPTGNLDPNTSLGIMNLLSRINGTGTTVVMATHDSGFVNQMRQRVIELSSGVVVRDQKDGVYGAGVPLSGDDALREPSGHLAGRAGSHLGPRTTTLVASGDDVAERPGEPEPAPAQSSVRGEW